MGQVIRKNSEKRGGIFRGVKEKRKVEGGWHFQPQGVTGVGEWTR